MYGSGTIMGAVTSGEGSNNEEKRMENHINGMEIDMEWKAQTAPRVLSEVPNVEVRVTPGRNVPPLGIEPLTT